MSDIRFRSDVRAVVIPIGTRLFNLEDMIGVKFTDNSRRIFKDKVWAIAKAIIDAGPSKYGRCLIHPNPIQFSYYTQRFYAYFARDQPAACRLYEGMGLFIEKILSDCNNDSIIITDPLRNFGTSIYEDLYEGLSKIFFPPKETSFVVGANLYFLGDGQKIHFVDDNTAVNQDGETLSYEAFCVDKDIVLIKIPSMDFKGTFYMNTLARITHRDARLAFPIEQITPGTVLQIKQVRSVTRLPITPKFIKISFNDNKTLDYFYLTEDSTYEKKNLPYVIDIDKRTIKFDNEIIRFTSFHNKMFNGVITLYGNHILNARLYCVPVPPPLPSK